MSSTIDFTRTFAEQFPERAAEREKERAAITATRPKSAPEDHSRLRTAMELRSRGIKLTRAVDQLLRRNPVEAVEWLEKAFESAPSIEPRT